MKSHPASQFAASPSLVAVGCARQPSEDMSKVPRGARPSRGANNARLAITTKAAIARRANSESFFAMPLGLNNATVM